VLAACAPSVDLSPYQFPRTPDDVEIRVIDARTVARPELERVLRDHYVLARFNAHVRGGDDREEQIARAVEKGKSVVRTKGGRVLVYTDDSQLIAAIMQDARFAGPSDAIVMYVLRPREQ
jgi:hypothetical protein